jgi:hypothetical protein
MIGRIGGLARCSLPGLNAQARSHRGNYSSFGGGTAVLPEVTACAGTEGGNEVQES